MLLWAVLDPRDVQAVDGDALPRQQTRERQRDLPPQRLMKTSRYIEEALPTGSAPRTLRS